MRTLKRLEPTFQLQYHRDATGDDVNPMVNDCTVRATEAGVDAAEEFRPKAS